MVLNKCGVFHAFILKLWDISVFCSSCNKYNLDLITVSVCSSKRFPPALPKDSHLRIKVWTLVANLCVKTMNPSFYTKAQGCIKCWSSVGFQQTFAIWVFPQNFVILIQNTQTKGKNKKTIRKTSFHSNHKQAKSEVDECVCVDAFMAQ